MSYNRMKTPKDLTTVASKLLWQKIINMHSWKIDNLQKYIYIYIYFHMYTWH